MVGSRVRLDQQFDRVQRDGADLDLLPRVVLEQRAGVDASHEVVVELEHAVDAQDVRDEVVGEQRQAVEVVRGRDARQREVGGGDLGALEQRHVAARVGRDVAARSASWRARSRAPRRSRRTVARRPGTSRRRARPARAGGSRRAPSGRARGPGPSCARSPSRVIVRSSLRRPGPAGAQPGLHRAVARQPVALADRGKPAGAEVDRVQLQAERRPRLVVGALEVGRRRRLGGQLAARRPRSAPRRSARSPPRSRRARPPRGCRR